MNFLSLALLNLFHFKRKSLIVGILITVSMIIMIISNSLIDNSISSLKASFTEVLSGEIVIRAQSEDEITLFGRMEDSVLSFLGFRDVFGTEKLPVLSSYKSLTEILAADENILCFTPILSGNALLSDTFEEAPGYYSTFFGIEPESYNNMFGEKIDMIKGYNLSNLSKGILLSETNRNTIQSLFHFQMNTGMKVRLLSSGTGAIKIRELDIRGVFSFRNTKINAFNRINLANAELLHDILGISVSAISGESISSEDRELLTVPTGNSISNSLIINEIEIYQDNVSLQDELENILSTKDIRSPIKSDVWHFILVRINESSNQESLINSLNRKFREGGLKAEAISWEKAAGNFFILFGITRIALNTIVTILLIVIVFVLMNTMIISIVERTNELGTMRALGAKKSFIVKLLIAESVLISIVFGVLGSVLSIFTAAGLNSMGLTTTNEFFSLLWNGDTLTISPDISIILESILMIVIVGVLATILYPVGIALRIRPVIAIEQK